MALMNEIFHLWIMQWLFNGGLEGPQNPGDSDSTVKTDEATAYNLYQEM